MALDAAIDVMDTTWHTNARRPTLGQRAERQAPSRRRRSVLSRPLDSGSGLMERFSARQRDLEIVD